MSHKGLKWLWRLNKENIALFEPSEVFRLLDDVIWAL